MGLVGRERELDVIDRRLRTVVGHRGDVVILEGVPGIGKTRLLRELGEAATARGLRVMSARGGVLERDLPFAVVKQLLCPALAALPAGERAALREGPSGLAAQMLGDHARTTPGQQPPGGPGEGFSHAMQHSLFWLAVRLAGEKAVLMTVDDLQWADAPSLRWLGYLTRRLANLPALLALSRTTGEPAAHQELLDDVLDSAGDTAVVTLRGLAAGETHQLVGELFGGAVDQRFSAACHMATGGNPFLLNSLLETLLDDTEDSGVAASAEFTGRIVSLSPQAVVDQIGARLGRVSPHATALVRALAVLGDGTDVATAASLAGLGRHEAVDTANALARLHLLEAGDSLRFRHSIVRAAVIGQLSEAERTAEHARAARLLYDRAAPAPQVAAHLLCCGPVGEPWVPATLRRAADETVRQGAPDIAVRLLQRALAEPLGSPGEQEHTELLLAVGTVALDVDMAAAIGHLTEALDRITDPTRRAAAAPLLAHALFQANRVDEAIGLVDRVIAEVAPVNRDATFVLEVARIGFSLVATDQHPVVAPMIGEMERRFPVVRNMTPVLAGVLAAWHTLPGRNAARVVELAEHSLRNLSPEREGHWGALAMHALIDCDELDTVERFCNRMIESGQRRGVLCPCAHAYAIRAEAVYRLGRVDQAREDAERALAMWENLQGDPRHLVFAALPSLVNASIDHGDLGGATAVLDRYGLWGDVSVHHRSALVLLEMRGRLRVERGDLSGGLADFTQCGRLAPQRNLENPAYIPWRSDAARVHLMLGEQARAHQLAHEELELARRWDRPRALATALRTAGVVTGGAEGIRQLYEAVSVLDGTPLQLDQSRALAAHGAALLRADRHEDARAQLHRAWDLAQWCGAVALARTIGADLDQVGVSRRQDRYEHHQPHGPGRLTPLEHVVADLAAAGLSDRAIAARLGIVQRTVEALLASAFRKLHVSGRNRLAGALTRTSHPAS